MIVLRDKNFSRLGKILDWGVNLGAISLPFVGYKFGKSYKKGDLDKAKEDNQREIEKLEKLSKLIKKDVDRLKDEKNVIKSPSGKIYLKDQVDSNNGEFDELYDSEDIKDNYNSILSNIENKRSRSDEEVLRKYKEREAGNKALSGALIGTGIIASKRIGKKIYKLIK